MYFQDQEPQPRSPHIDSGEILDDIITRSRGEIRRVHSPKITSSTPGSQEDMKPAYSPRVPQRTHSPRLRDLKLGRSPSETGIGVEIKQTPSPRLSPLGQSTYGSSSTQNVL